MLSSFPFFMHFNRKYGQFYPKLGSDYISFRKVVVMTAEMGHLEGHCKKFIRQFTETLFSIILKANLQYYCQRSCTFLEFYSPVNTVAVMLSQSPTVLSTSFRKLFFCLALYTEEVNLQTFVMI